MWCQQCLRVIIQHDKSIAQGQKNQDRISSGKRGQFSLIHNPGVRAQSGYSVQPSRLRNVPCPKPCSKWRKTLFLHKLKLTDSPPMRCTQPSNKPMLALAVCDASSFLHCPGYFHSIKIYLPTK